MKKIGFKIIVSLLMYIILLLPVWWPEAQVYVSGKSIKCDNPMYPWAKWWTYIGFVAIFWAALDSMEEIADKLYEWLRK